MKPVKWLFLLMALGLVLAACQSSTAAPAKTQETNTYPAPQANQAYPGPTQQNAVAGASGYPAPNGQSSNVEWAAAKDSITSAMVYRIEQGKDLKVTLYLKNGSTQVTTEAAFDDVRKAVEACGPACKIIEIVDK